jgi:hypothetical protein
MSFAEFLKAFTGSHGFTVGFLDHPDEHSDCNGVA